MKIRNYKVAYIGIEVCILIIFLFQIFLKIFLVSEKETSLVESNESMNDIYEIRQINLSEVLGALMQGKLWNITDIKLNEDGGDIVLCCDGTMDNVKEGLDLIKNEMPFVSSINTLIFTDKECIIEVTFNNNIYT